MAISVQERFSSPVVTSGVQKSVQKEYVVRGTDDEFLAHDTVAAMTPYVIWDLRRTSIRLERQAYQVYYATVEWTRPEFPPDKFTFSTTGQTAHIDISLATVYKDPPNAPDVYGLIGVSEDNVEGVDIIVPTLRYTFTRNIPIQFWTQSKIFLVHYLTGKVNSEPFMGFAPGEVLFEGAEGNWSTDSEFIEVTFSFALSPNQSQLAIGPFVVEKAGWDYVWILTEDQVDNAAKKLVRRPIAAYVEQVYPRADLNLLL